MTTFVTYRCCLCGGERSMPSEQATDTGTCVTSLYPPCRLCGHNRFERLSNVQKVEPVAEPVKPAETATTVPTP